VTGLAPHDALACAAVACGAFAALCWLLSVATGNYSQVDRFWSIAPPLYVTWFAAQARFADARLDLMMALAIAWGARLTYNFARKGGYRAGSEDYRWPFLRERLGTLRFQALNATFIAPFQNAQLLLISLSAWIAYAHRGAPLGPVDALAAAAFVAFLAGETVADEQQWRFQSDKHARKSRGEPVAAEFLTGGLFRWSRHPNFFCEQAMWWTFYLFSVGAGAGWLNPALAGPVVLTLLFQGSTTVTERLTLAKYPAYADYQRTTSRLVPWPPRRAK
jgi:steroid 5-alpha reductase family enzyme